MQATEQLVELRRQLETARAHLSVDAVHEVRVVGRRLHVFLLLCRLPVLVDDLRWLVGALGPVRDLDVALGLMPGKQGAFHDWLTTRREAATAGALAVVRHRRVDALVRALAVLPALTARQATPAFRRLEERLARAWRVGRRERTVEALHDVRKAVRRARYALEWLGRDAEGLRETQGVLGEVCDLSLLQRLLAEAGAPAAVDHVDRALNALTAAVFSSPRLRRSPGKARAREGWSPATSDRV